MNRMLLLIRFAFLGQNTMKKFYNYLSTIQKLAIIRTQSLMKSDETKLCPK